MRHSLRKCKECKIYTLKNTCKICGNKTVIAHPAKFSPDDKYLIYKIRALKP